jgi:ATP-dependent DNA helicase RecQ
MGGRYPRTEEIHAVYTALQQLGAGSRAAAVDEVTAQVEGVVGPLRVRAVLSLLKSLGIAKSARAGHVMLLNAGLSAANITAVADAYRERQSADKEKLERMMGYGQSAACRWIQLLEYFGESLEQPCGTCDNCRVPLEVRIAQPA